MWPINVSHVHEFMPIGVGIENSAEEGNYYPYCNRAARSCKSELSSQCASKKMFACTFLMNILLVGS